MIRPSTSFDWVSRDARLIIIARAIRTFGQSFIAVLLALYLTELGFNLVQIGTFLSAEVIGVAAFAFVVGLISDRVGRRNLLVAFSLVSAASRLALFFVDAFIPLLLIALSGPNKLLFHPPFLHHQPGSRRFDELRTPGRSDSASLTGRRLLRLYRAGGW